jgi:hypothetical protein
MPPMPDQKPTLEYRTPRRKWDLVDLAFFIFIAVMFALAWRFFIAPFIIATR